MASMFNATSPAKTEESTDLRGVIVLSELARPALSDRCWIIDGLRQGSVACPFVFPSYVHCISGTSVYHCYAVAPLVSVVLFIITEILKYCINIVVLFIITERLKYCMETWCSSF